MKNKSTIALIIILSVFAVFLTISLVYLINRNNNFNFNFNFIKTKLNKVDSYESNMNEINDIYLNLYSTDVEIEENDTDKISVEYFSNRKNNAKIEYKNNKISINEKNFDVTCIGICNSSRKVKVYVPMNYSGKIEIYTKSGDISSEANLVNSNLLVDSLSGDSNLSILGTAKISTKSGDVLIKKVENKININTLSGDVVIDNLKIKDNSSITTVSGDQNIKSNNSNCYVDVKTTSGDQSIGKSNRKSDMVLKMKSVSGDISVK